MPVQRDAASYAIVVLLPQPAKRSNANARANANAIPDADADADADPDAGPDPAVRHTNPMLALPDDHHHPMIDDLWYKNAVFYCLDVETFMDANGDGVGDFEGLTRRLDYLAGLGVDCLWLLPFYPSPNRDDGYDIADYYGVDPRLGTLGDFVEFTQQAAPARHPRDHRPGRQPHLGPAPLVPGGPRATENSPYRDYYVWSKKKPADADKGMVFPGVQKTTWTYDKEARAYYFHRFYDFQPDLNFANPAVREEIRKIMGFWLELGVSGFRVDAVPFLIETCTNGARRRPGHSGAEQTRCASTTCASCATSCSGAAATRSCWPRPTSCPTRTPNYFGDGDRMHMLFNFQVNQNLFYALATRRRAAAGQGPASDRRKLPGAGAVGHLPAQPRRARPRAG